MHEYSGLKATLPLVTRMLVYGHQAGEPVQLKVRRGTDELKDITVIRP